MRAQTLRLHLGCAWFFTCTWGETYCLSTMQNHRKELRKDQKQKLDKLELSLCGFIILFNRNSWNIRHTYYQEQIHLCRAWFHFSIFNITYTIYFNMEYLIEYGKHYHSSFQARFLVNCIVFSLFSSFIGTNNFTTKFSFILIYIVFPEIFRLFTNWFNSLGWKIM